MPINQKALRYSKEYRREYSRRYYKKNIERERARSRATYASNRIEVGRRHSELRKLNISHVLKREAAHRLTPGYIAYRKKYEEEYKDVLKERRRQYSKKNSTAIVARVTRWRKANPERYKAQLKAYRKANPEKFAIRWARAWAKNKEKIRASSRISSKKYRENPANTERIAKKKKEYDQMLKKANRLYRLANPKKLPKFTPIADVIGKVCCSCKLFKTKEHFSIRRPGKLRREHLKATCKVCEAAISTRQIKNLEDPYIRVIIRNRRTCGLNFGEVFEINPIPNGLITKVRDELETTRLINQRNRNA